MITTEPEHVSINLDTLEERLVESFHFTCDRPRPPRGTFHPAKVTGIAAMIMRVANLDEKYRTAMFYQFDFKHEVWFTPACKETGYFKYLAKIIAGQIKAAAVAANVESLPSMISTTCDHDGYGTVIVHWSSIIQPIEGQPQ